LLGAPAVLALVTIGAVTVLARTGREARLRVAYSGEGARLLEARNYSAAQVCYLRLLGFDAASPEYRFGLARAEGGMGRTGRAEALLRALAPTDRPGHAPAQFEAARRLLDRPTADPRALRAAELHLRNGLRSQPDSGAGNVLMARVYLATGRLKEAVAILEHGLDLTGAPGYRTALAEVYLARAERQDGQTTEGESLGTQLALLESGLIQDPRNARLLNRFAELIQLDGPGASRRRGALRALLVRGRATAGVHLALAVDAREQGDLRVARSHFAHATRLAPRMKVVANNLAWVLADSPSPQLTRALNLINLAVEQNPDDLRLRETRDAILAKRAHHRTGGQARDRYEVALGDPG
jgi:tetratricopeptide (TPR) repeat protein